MTSMNFKLSPALLQSLTTGGSGNNIYAYAFSFSSGNLVGYSTLINNGVVDLVCDQPASVIPKRRCVRRHSTGR
jgi:hypothetical protein